jgi:hypothetical protein
MLLRLLWRLNSWRPTADRPLSISSFWYELNSTYDAVARLEFFVTCLVVYKRKVRNICEKKDTLQVQEQREKEKKRTLHQPCRHGATTKSVEVSKQIGHVIVFTLQPCRDWNELVFRCIVCCQWLDWSVCNNYNDAHKNTTRHFSPSSFIISNILLDLSIFFQSSETGCGML